MPRCVQLVHDRNRRQRIVHRHPFGQLQFQVLRRQLHFVEDLHHQFRQARMTELHRRQVDRDRHRSQAAGEPVLALAYRLAQHPFADLQDLAALFGNRDEVGRRHHAEFGMLPAQQRFGADDAAILEADLGLVVQFQLIALERTAQRIFQLQRMHGAGLHFGSEKAVTVAPALFGAVHRGVGPLRQRVEIVAVAGIHRNPDRGRDGQLILLDVVRLLRRFEQFFRDMGGAAGIGIGQHQDEFIAAQTRYRVLFAHHQVQASGQRDQQFVADAVAQRVVDVLEVIEIEENQRQRLMAALRAAERVADAVLEQAAVRQPGERIEMREPLDMLLRCLVLGDVAEDADIVAQRAAGIAYLADRQPLRKDAAVLAPVPHLALPVALVIDGLPHGPIERLILAARGQHARILAQRIGLAVAGDLGKRMVDHHDAAAGYR